MKRKSMTRVCRKFKLKCTEDVYWDLISEGVADLVNNCSWLDGDYLVLDKPELLLGEWQSRGCLVVAKEIMALGTLKWPSRSDGGRDGSKVTFK